MPKPVSDLGKKLPRKKFQNSLKYWEGYYKVALKKGFRDKLLKQAPKFVQTVKQISPFIHGVLVGHMIDGKVIKTEPKTNAARISSLQVSLDSVSHSDIIESYKRLILAEKNIVSKVQLIKEFKNFTEKTKPNTSLS